MADPSVVTEWMHKADEDFLFAEVNFVEGREFYAQICYHFQQAAEKYLKAYIIGKGLAFEKVHDLVHLLKPVQPLRRRSRNSGKIVSFSMPLT